MKNVRFGFCLLTVVLILPIVAAAARGDSTAISLAGPWRFLRGGPTESQHPADLPPLSFSATINLPGTTDTEREGPEGNYRSTGSLTQPYSFTGTCWYDRDISIPDSWRGKRVTVFLERTKYTQCWLDHRPVGENPICCSPQQYTLGTLAPGKHAITLAVDNKRLPPYGADAHQFSGGTQGNWNGIIGKVELRMTDPVWIDDVQVYPDAAGKKVTVKIRVDDSGNSGGEAAVAVSAKGPGIGGGGATTTHLHWTAGGTDASVTLPLGPGAQLWDEFHPVVDALTVRLSGATFSDEKHVTFGLRDFAAHGPQFTINGQPTFLRGKHDACVFPLTGCPPMTTAGWLSYLRTCQSYGLNHIRFHTWTPPEAAFEAADQLGFYLQPELPFWGSFDAHVKDALEPEADGILKSMGNHPSFVMFSMGNEHWGGKDVLQALVTELRARDPRHLYARGSSAFSYEGQPGKNDDYMINSDAKPVANGPQFHLRGSNGGDSNQGHVQTGPPNTMTTYSDAIAGTKRPTITHEMGQYTVYPDFKQIAKYTGATRAYNLEFFRQKLIDAGMADQDADFARASGALAELCYREEIETCLRTPHYGGFELLDLQDYPGQGSALVGMLDVFMDSKNIVTPEQWRQFCAPVALLAKFPKYVWTTNDTFTAAIELAQYGPKNLDGVGVKWMLKDAGGRTLRSGELTVTDAARGGLRPLGRVSIPLDNLPAPARVTLDLSLTGTAVHTSYTLWVYPPKVDTAPPADVTIARTFDAAARQGLATGRRVVLICDGRKPLAHTVGGGFATDFWNFSFFHNRPATEGIFCDPSSPALAAFPTESQSDWHWFDIALHSQPLILDDGLPVKDRPIVQVIDNDERCHKLGLVFEAHVGPGRLLVCATDLIDLAPAHPEARQLLASLLAYAGSERFHPSAVLSADDLQTLLRTTIPLTGCVATASSYDKGWQGYSPSQLIDGNDDKGWKADSASTGDAWCQVEFPRSTDLHGIEIVWPDAKRGYQYRIESSNDGSRWLTIADERSNTFTGARHEIAMDAAGVKFIRVVVSGMPDHAPAAIGELRFYPAS